MHRGEKVKHSSNWSLITQDALLVFLLPSNSKSYLSLKSRIAVFSLKPGQYDRYNCRLSMEGADIDNLSVSFFKRNSDV